MRELNVVDAFVTPVTLGWWTAALVLGGRGAGGLVQGLFGETDPFVIVFEALFLTGGVLFGLAARDYAVRRRALEFA
jgi:hypothetical protein